MTPDTTVSFAGPHVVAEEIEGEVIAINLETGAYFSFRGSASLICQQLLAGGGRPGNILDELCARFLGPREEIERALFAFLRDIEAEGLIAAHEMLASEQSRGRTDPGTDAERHPFTAPVFEKYTDMEEFLLVDPIHEVDVSKWPTVHPRERR